VIRVKTEEAKNIVKVANELSESYTDLAQALKGTAKESRTSKQLWRNGNNPILIKAGLALIVFPEPIVSDVLGTFLIAAGTVQQGIRRRSIYVDNVYKTFQETMKEIKNIKENL
jgi:hypothetical protein